jgi:L-rhamnose mutarotase
MRYCCTLDLKNDPALIAEYEAYHKKVWPEVLQSIRDSGIVSMEIWRYQTKLFMILEVSKDFSFERKAKMDAGNAKVQEWEELMLRFQQPLAGSASKWQLMDKIFETS